MPNKVFVSIDWKTFRKLSASLQQAWFYGWTNCDACGIFEYDEDYARIDLGRKVTENDFDKLEGFGVSKIGTGKYLFFDFIAVNYVNLKPDYNPHKPAFRALEKNSLSLNEKNSHVDISSYPQAWLKLEGEGEGKEEEEGKEEDKRRKTEKKQSPAASLFAQKVVKMPWESVEFIAAWQRWKEFKQKQHSFKFKSEDSEQAALIDLSKISHGHESEAIQIINQSIAKGWKGLFELKNNQNNGYQKPATGAGVSLTDIAAAVNGHFGTAGQT